MITPLRANMSPDVQLFFMDPLEVATKLHKQLLKVIDFQKTQRKRLTGLLGYQVLLSEKNKLDLIIRCLHEALGHA